MGASRYSASVQGVAAMKRYTIRLTLLLTALLWNATPPAAPLLAQAVPNAKPTQMFEMQVVRPDGKPVPEANVGLRGDSSFRTASQVKRGSVVGQKDGWKLKADADGWLAIEFSSPPKFCQLDIIEPGYGPYLARWDSHEHPEPKIGRAHV